MPSEIFEQLTSYLRQHEESYLHLLEQMVSINSFTANQAGVNRLGKVTAEHFADLGFTAEYIPAENEAYGNHVVLTRHGRSRQKIGLVSHLDTVFSPEEEARHRFSWRVERNRIYGPGTVDIKGGTLIIYMMMSALAAVLPEVYEAITWVVLLNACEEVGESDFGELCVARLQDEGLACLVFEGGYMDKARFRTVVVRKGMATYQLIVNGKAAHAGSAHKRGANAIVQMAEVVSHVHELTDYDRDLTFNVGTITGGTVTNRVPHFAAAEVEMRAFDTAVFNDGLERILRLNKWSGISNDDGDYSCRVQVTVTRKTPPWPRNEGTEKLFHIWQAAAADLGYVVQPEARGGLSDGNHIWPYLPTIDGLGPAGGNAHCSERSADGSKDQEYVYAPSFVPKTLLNIAGLLRVTEK